MAGLARKLASKLACDQVASRAIVHAVGQAELTGALFEFWVDAASFKTNPCANHSASVVLTDGVTRLVLSAGPKRLILYSPEFGRLITGGRSGRPLHDVVAALRSY